MINLIIKDIRLLKNSIFMITGSFVFFYIFRYIARPVLIFYPFILSFILIMDLFAKDEKNKVFTCLCSLPVKRSTIVLEKYLIFHILLFLSIPVSYVFLQFYPNSNYSLNIIFNIFLIYSLFFSLIFPVNYKFGFNIANDNKNLIYASLFFFTLLILLFILLYFFDIDPFLAGLKKFYFSIYFTPSFTVLAVVAGYLSFKLSSRVYQKRDLG